MCQTASDVAHKLVEYNFGDIENVILIHEDLIIAGDDFESHDKTPIDVFERASTRNIKFNRDEIQYCVSPYQVR